MKLKIKCEEVGNDGGQNLKFTLPDGNTITATEIGYEYVPTGEYADINQYRYRTKYFDEYGFDLGYFNDKEIVKYNKGFYSPYDENLLKFAKKVLLYWCKAYSNDWELNSFEMPSKYFELLDNVIEKKKLKITILERDSK